MNRENHWRLAQEDVWMYPLALLDLGIAIPPGCSQHMVAAPSDQDLIPLQQAPSLLKGL